MTTLRLSLVSALCAAALAAPVPGAAAGCPRVVDPVGDSSYGLLGKGASDLDIVSVDVASGARTVVVAVRLVSMAGTAPELRLGSRIDARLSLAPVDYFLSARRSGSGSWTYTMATIRTGADGRPVDEGTRSVTGRVDVAAGEVIFVVARNELFERPDGKVMRLVDGRAFLGDTASVQEADRIAATVSYRDRTAGCRKAD